MSKHRIVAVFFISVLLLLTLLSCWVTINGWYFVLIAFMWFATAFIGSSIISLNYHVKAYSGNPSETKKRIAITFDDGPNAFTESVLDVLKQHDVKAAFFCIGKHIEQYPNTFKRIVSEGHIVGNHSYSHAPLFDFYRQERIQREIQTTDALIQKISGKKVQFFRPPYGVTNPSIRRALAVTQHKVIGWNIRSFDTVIKNEHKLLNRIKHRIVPGGIILMHDTSHHTINVLEQLLLFLQENEYTVVSLAQLLNITPYED
jgi:peptidoglycan-N-acetylglucosamine deacetylase